MITGFFITVLTVIANAFVSLLPEFALPSDWLSGLNTVWGLMNTVSYLLPLGTLLSVVAIALFLHVSVFVWHLSLKVFALIRGT